MVAVIGDPIAHSLSPALHNAAFEAAGLDWTYVAFGVPAGLGADAVRAVRVLGLGGLSVTAPHKLDAASAVDRLSETAATLGAVNTVIPEDGELVGDSTDGPGLLDALAAYPGWRPAGERCLVLGAGGAARAVTLALADAGAAEVTVVARRAGPAAACAALAGAAGRVAAAGDPTAVAAAGLVVDATGAGGAPGAGLPDGIDPGSLRPGQVVVDLVYSPAVTPLLAAAHLAGATGCNGLRMLLHQAARQWSSWTGLPAPIDAMASAVGLAGAG